MNAIYRFFILFLLFFITYAQIQAQNNSDSYTSLRPKLAITISPLDLLAIDGSHALMVGIDKYFNKYINWTLEGGYINEMDFLFRNWNINIADRSGIKLRGSLKFYHIGGDRFTKKNYYLQLEWFYNNFKFDREQWVSQSNGFYEQLVKFKQKEEKLGGHIKMGKLFNISKPLYGEINFGVGFYGGETTINIPTTDDIQITENDGSILAERAFRIYSNFNMSFKLGFDFASRSSKQE